MKKALLLIFMITVSISARSQLFLTVAPIDFKVGVLYNCKPDYDFGFYARAQYGNIKSDQFYADDLKLGAGVSIWMNKHTIVFVGGNHTRFMNVKDNNSQIDLNYVNKVSFDIGIAVRDGRFTGLMMTDPVNWESIVGFSYRFN